MTKKEQLEQNFDSFLVADGFDDAIIGMDEQSERVIYSISKCIEVLMKDEMTYEDAMDYLYYNCVGAYVGEQTPIWCWDLFY
jgi:hypothetical protein